MRLAFRSSVPWPWIERPTARWTGNARFTVREPRWCRHPPRPPRSKHEARAGYASHLSQITWNGPRTTSNGKIHVSCNLVHIKQSANMYHRWRLPQRWINNDISCLLRNHVHCANNIETGNIGKNACIHNAQSIDAFDPELRI